MASLLIAWVNLATTARWAEEPGALHGWRLWPYATALAVVTLLAIFGRSTSTATDGEARGVAAIGLAMVTLAFVSTFPPSSWTRIPFYDDWPGLLQLTLNGIDTLRHGALVGWQWAFLGGYHTSADLSQSLAVPALAPIVLAGPAAGFHLFLALITAAIPVAIWRDVGDSDGPGAGAYAAGLSGIVTAGYFATVMHSGMANSTAGAAAIAVALWSSHAARRGRAWGGPMLVAALTLALYSHAAFYIYGTVCLAVEALFYRDWRGAVRSAFALGTAFIAALPLHWELLRYPGWFVSNNLYFDAPPAFDWAGLLRQIWWATEMLVLPWRWFNDYGGLTYVFMLVLTWTAWHDRSRGAFYAWATLAIVVTLRLNSPQLGLVAGRQLHLLPVLVAPALAAYVCRYAPGGMAGRLTLTAVIGLFIAVPFTAVRHVPDVTAFNPELVQRIKRAGGHLVLIENNPHWDMISDPAVRTEKSRFDVHYESLLPAATGRLFYGQPQDGYHRSIFRGHSLAGGGFRGQAIETVPVEAFIAEMRRWGVQHLFVWTAASRRYLASHPEFALRWQQADWQQYELLDADTRAVVTRSGTATLGALTPIGGDVVLNGVGQGSEVVVRTHFHPAWRAFSDGHAVALKQREGQIAFDAPGGGIATVHLSYDRRAWLSVIALVTLVAGMALLGLPAFYRAGGFNLPGRVHGVR